MQSSFRRPAEPGFGQVIYPNGDVFCETSSDGPITTAKALGPVRLRGKKVQIPDGFLLFIRGVEG